MKKKINLFYVFVFLIIITFVESSYIVFFDKKPINAQTEKSLESSLVPTTAAAVVLSTPQVQDLKPVKKVSKIATIKTPEIKKTVATTTATTTPAIATTTPKVVPKPVPVPVPAPTPTPTPPPAPKPTPDITPPSAPAELTATLISPTQANLSWMASADNVGVTNYKVYRNGTEITSTGSSSYSDNGLLASTTYSYTVYAFDAAENVSSQSGSVSITTE